MYSEIFIVNRRKNFTLALARSGSLRAAAWGERCLQSEFDDPRSPDTGGGDEGFNEDLMGWWSY